MAIVVFLHGIPFLGPPVALVVLLVGVGLLVERGRELRALRLG